MPTASGPDRASAAGPLEQLADRVEAAYAAGDLDRVLELLRRDPIVAWFGMDPNRFTGIMRALSRGKHAADPLVRAFSQMMLGDDSDGLEAAIRSLTRDSDDELPAEALSAVGRMFLLRLQGRPAEAWRAAETVEMPLDSLTPVFDRSRGWGLFVAVQRGVTAMLAGDFDAALVNFTHARMSASPPALRFLVRDACVKSAVLEGLFGDPDRAAALLDEADRIERTSSWAELHIDAAHAIAASRARVETTEQALRMLDAIPMREIGEIWPFYVFALHRTQLRAGDGDAAAQRLAIFDRLPLPRVDGEGFTGSALHLAAAIGLLLQGDLAAAAERLGRADPENPITGLTRSVVDILTGNPREALHRASELRAATRRLRGLEGWRLASVASAYFALGSEEECAEVLEHMLSRPEGMLEREVLYLPPRVREFAEQRFEAWPRAEAPGPDLFRMPALEVEFLTQREIDALRGLAAGLSREQIARSQYVSINTLKSHLRSLYRKLGVRSRTGALLEGERRGLI